MFADQVWRPRTSVKVRFSLAQGFFIALIISLLALALYVPVRDRFVTITDGSYRLLADNLASGIYASYLNKDVEGIADSVSQIKGLKGVKYVLVLDENNNVYFDSMGGDSSLEGAYYGDSLTSSDIREGVKVGKVEREGLSYYNYVAPFVSQNKILYTVRLGVDPNVIDKEFNDLGRLFISLGVFSVLVGIVAAYFLASRLTRPIVQLTESALAIRAGNLNAYATISTNDELEQLSREFQNMVEKLKAFYFQEYNQKKQALEAKRRVEDINAQLQELDRQKSDFLNAASHQLRTPLSIIHWSLSMIVEEGEKLKLPDEKKDLLTESLKSTRRMVDLVNDLLDISRIEQGRKQLSWGKGNFAKVCEQLVQSLQVLAANKKLTLTFVQEGEVPDSFLDEKSFYQVLNNFVDNAIKYTAEGSVEVRCRKKGNAVEIVVADTGIGISEEEKKLLFTTQFMRGSDASKMFANGSGLGMYVAYSILKQHGGSVAVESIKGKGTTFTLTLPLYDKDPSAELRITEKPLIDDPNHEQKGSSHA